MTGTVLVIDDDAGIRELLKFRLEKNGYAVVTGANGQVCLDYLRAEPLPELVLLDFECRAWTVPAPSKRYERSSPRTFQLYC